MLRWYTKPDSPFAEFNFLHFAVVLFVICVIILIGVSLMSDPPPSDKVSGLTFETADQPVAGLDAMETRGAAGGDGQVATEERTMTEEELALDLEESTRSRRRDLWLSIGVVICVAIVWIVFA